MKKYLIFPLAILLATIACAGFSSDNPVNLGSAPSAMTPSTPEPFTAVPPVEFGNTPEVVVVTENPNFSGHQPIGTATKKAFVPPTPVVGNNVVVLGGDIPSTIFITVDGVAYACRNDTCQYEQTLGVDLPESVMYALFFSPRENENTITFIGGNPHKIWYDNGGILTCTAPCQGEFEVMNNYEFEDGVMALNESGQVAAKDAIKFWREAADNGNACLPSGEAIGRLSYCFRNIVTPTP